MTARALKSRYRLFRSRLNRYRSLGACGERQAARYLSRQRYVVWSRNWRRTFGEIDLVAVKDRTAVFVEVKARRGGDTAAILDNMTEEKERRLLRTMRSFLDDHGPELRRRRIFRWRLDVIAISFPRSAGMRKPAVVHIIDWFGEGGG